jgi:hypothetical protein
MAELSKAKLKKLYKGIELDFEKRWEKDLDHHPKAMELMDHLMALDFHCNNDSFCWKRGGDGDNGEELLYALDCYFERLDKEASDG